MTATLYSWTVTVDNGTEMPVTGTIDAAMSATAGDGTLWQLLGADGRPVYEVPVSRLVSAWKGPALPQAAGTAGTACADDGPAAAAGDSATDDLPGIARMTGSDRLAGVALGAKRLRDLEAEALAPASFSNFTKAWGEACRKAWDDGYREPAAVLPDFLWPKVAQLVNPVTRNAVTVRRTDPFPFQSAPLAGGRSRVDDERSCGPEPARDPQPGDHVIIRGEITAVSEGRATVVVYRSDPVGLSVPVQCGALELDETRTGADASGRESGE